ncbi:MAG: aspartate carbamoyltransferase [Methylobacter sp.]|uniref:Aspartate carbamoyltransferase n=1 Tax=Candidatus Methylobacter titanis TaxID=3053457 RepID=A0AA43Q1N8_9GAMM|nr:aspartate carbamoyltransferase [Candidatus Methylobacter titanis]MDI1292813.1 aspartate carbamoyltransferase [Candidatus Methylobacter titanis]
MKNHLLILTGLLLFSATALALEKTGPVQSDKVHQRMQQLVPFSVDQTLETFTKTVHGGIQHVVAKAADNTEQIKLIRAHLLKIANEFRKGDFSVTERIHGADMPGLAQLKKAETDDIKFEYKVLPDGAQIHYSTEYPEFVQALHLWFDAQKIEHGNTEIPEHSQHHSTPAE